MSLIKINIEHAVTWEEADEMARKENAMLPTQGEFQTYSVEADNGCTDMWMPASRPDGKEGEWV